MGLDTCMIYWPYFPQDHNLIVEQGVLEAVHGYPTRRTYAEFVDRFGVSDGPT
jgi:hypothetical protein